MRTIPVFIALAVVLAIPFLLRPSGNMFGKAEDTLVIVTPHNEAIRFEFSRAFAEHYRAQTGRTVFIDWRTPGGTSEIDRYLQSEFEAAFRNVWINNYGQPWNSETARFADPNVDVSGVAEADTPAQAARRAFLASSVGIGIDLFFGGGSYDFSKQARAGRLVDCGLHERHPGFFGGGEGIPQSLGGELFYDPQHRWYGTCLSAFGLCFNTNSLEKIGWSEPMDEWADLGNPRLRGELALADPTKSGSIAKAFEMLIQQQMHLQVKRGQTREAALEEGWAAGLRLIQRMAGNARYFTDSASKIVVDVALGDAAAGMCIDFYGRQQSEAVTNASGQSRLQYITPNGGSSIGVDPIGLLRGAPNPEVARAFIAFVLSPKGQRLWNQRPGTPGGPQKYALRRLPIMPELYNENVSSAEYRSDPHVNPYAAGAAMNYEPTWTQPLFGPIRFVVKVLCLDPHHELRDAWRAIVENGMPEHALAVFHDVTRVSYAESGGAIKAALSSRDKVAEVRLARELSEYFRAQYRKARELAIASGKSH